MLFFYLFCFLFRCFIYFFANILFFLFNFFYIIIGVVRCIFIFVFAFRICDVVKFFRGSLTNFCCCCCCCCFVVFVVVIVARCNFSNLHFPWKCFVILFLLLLIFLKTYLIVLLFFFFVFDCYWKMFTISFKLTEHFRELLLYYFFVSFSDSIFSINQW